MLLILTHMATITKASEMMSAADAAKMAALKAEYCKLSTSAKRMKAVYAEMKALRSGVTLDITKLSDYPFGPAVCA